MLKQTFFRSFPRGPESGFYLPARTVQSWILAFAGATLFFASALARAEVETVKPSIPLTDQQEGLYRNLLPELRCLVCQNESLAESQAPLAADLRYEVRGLLAKGGNEEQVKKYLTDRYGDFVLYKPRFAPRTYLLWLGPFVLLLVALTWVVSYARRMRAAPAALPKPDAAALKKILDDNP